MAILADGDGYDKSKRGRRKQGSQPPVGRLTTFPDHVYFLQQAQHWQSSQVQLPSLQPSQHLQSSPQQQAFALQQSLHLQSVQSQFPPLQPSQQPQPSLQTFAHFGLTLQSAFPAIAFGHLPHEAALPDEIALPVLLLTAKAAVNERSTTTATPRIIWFFVIMNFLSVKCLNVPSDTVSDSFLDPKREIDQFRKTHNKTWSGTCGGGIARWLPQRDANPGTLAKPTGSTETTPHKGLIFGGLTDRTAGMTASSF